MTLIQLINELIEHRDKIEVQGQDATLQGVLVSVDNSGEVVSFLGTRTQ